MYEEDYVKRLVQLLARAVLRLLRLVKDNDYGTARTQVHYILDELLGVSESMILTLSEEDVLERLNRGGPPDPQRAAVLADVVRLNGEIAAGEGKPDQAAEWYKASLRYLAVAADKMGFQPSPKRLRKYENILHGLLPGGLSAALLASLYALYRAAGNHAIASELIVAFTEKTNREAAGVEEAKTYLAELSAMGEDALGRCGMSRESVLAMLAGLSSSGP